MPWWLWCCQNSEQSDNSKHFCGIKTLGDFIQNEISETTAAFLQLILLWSEKHWGWQAVTICSRFSADGYVNSGKWSDLFYLQFYTRIIFDRNNFLRSRFCKNDFYRIFPHVMAAVLSYHVEYFETVFWPETACEVIFVCYEKNQGWYKLWQSAMRSALMDMSAIGNKVILYTHNFIFIVHIWQKYISFNYFTRAQQSNNFSALAVELLKFVVSHQYSIKVTASISHKIFVLCFKRKIPNGIPIEVNLYQLMIGDQTIL